MEITDENRWHTFRARFEPLRSDDLREGVASWIGKVVTCTAGWLIGPEDNDELAGQYAMIVREHEFPASWIPSGDLVKAEEI